MPFIFSCLGADFQIGSSSAITLTSSTSSQKIKREAAHSSTIPTLLAQAFPDQAPFVYLKGGSSYFQHNTTIGMCELVNGADELIDGNNDKSNKLRTKTIDLINTVALGILTPEKATLEFMKKFLLQAKIEIDNLKYNPTDGRLAVLKKYQEIIQRIQEAASDPTFFDRQIGVQIENNESKETAELRKIIYKRRIETIRHQEISESIIAKKIADTKKEMSTSDKGFLEDVLLSSFQDNSEKLIFEKLFAKTHAIIEKAGNSSDPKALKTYKTRITNVKKKYSTLIDNLARDLRIEFRKLSASEFSLRAQVFKDLRMARNWSQIDFCDEY